MLIKLTFEVIIESYTVHLVQEDACGQVNSGPACCTNEIMNSYALSLGDDFVKSIDIELVHISRIFAIARQQTDGEFTTTKKKFLIYFYPK